MAKDKAPPASEPEQGLFEAVEEEMNREVAKLFLIGAVVLLVAAKAGKLRK